MASSLPAAFVPRLAADPKRGDICTSAPLLPPPTVLSKEGFAAVQVAHRCRCHDHRVCAEQETLASYFQRSGKLPPLPPPKKADVDHLFVGNW